MIYFLPAVISGVVMMMMWRIFFNENSYGLLNQVIGLFGFEPHNWLGSKSTAMMAIMIPQAWAGLGVGCLIYLAALKTVPEELYEAVAIDGGGFFNRIRYITIPSIKSLIFIQLIFALIAAFQASDAVLIMTAGGPDYATNVVGLEIFFNAYMFQRFGVATTMAWILGFLLMGLTVFQMKRLSRMTFTTAET
jgi:multiple sugar transport system permease protein